MFHILHVVRHVPHSAHASYSTFCTLYVSGKRSIVSFLNSYSLTFTWVMLTRIPLLVSVTPFDVVRIRLQAQKKPLTKGMCFMYCNGLMDHVCTCLNGPTVEMQWYKKGGQFNGVQVRAGPEI